MFATRSGNSGGGIHAAGLTSALGARRASITANHLHTGDRFENHVKLVGVGAVITALTLQTSASPAIAATGVPFTNSKVDSIYGSGSDTTFALMNDLASPT